MGFKPSKYQSAIYSEFDSTANNLLINAVAGSGKTSTLLQLLKRTNASTAFLAFNKSIQQEIEAKVHQPNVDVMTIHSLGMKSLIRHFRKRIDVKASKIWDFAKKLNQKWKIPNNKYVQTIMRVQGLVDIYRLTMCNTVEDLRNSADSLGIDYTPQELNYALQILQEYEKYNQNPAVIDFVDMVYLPATNKDIKLTLNPQLVFIDECQDLNACQHALIDRLINENSARFVACGDPYQSIYGFAGAHSESFNIFKTKENVKEMPLSICYRCPSTIVDKANTVYDIMEAWTGSGEGDVREGSISEIKEGDMVICRTLKPLIKIYFDLLARGQKGTIKGKDLGKGLISLIKPYERNSTGELMVALEKKLNEKKFELIEREIENPTNHPSYINLLEKVEVIRFVEQQFASTAQMIDFFQNLFADNQRNGVILSTIHKCKGLENDTVFLLDKQLIPSKYAKTKDQLKQEQNLLYVAFTRAKKRLIFIKSK